MRRRRVVAGIVSLAAVVAVGLPLLLHRPKPCRATFESVRREMTFDEICATVGRPPADYSDGRCVHSRYRMTGDRVGWWLADDGELVVLIDPEGRAINVWARPAARYPTPSLWARVRARLGLCVGRLLDHLSAARESSCRSATSAAAVTGAAGTQAFGPGARSTEGP